MKPSFPGAMPASSFLEGATLPPTGDSRLRGLYPEETSHELTPHEHCERPSLAFRKPLKMPGKKAYTFVAYLYCKRPSPPPKKTNKTKTKQTIVCPIS